MTRDRWRWPLLTAVLLIHLTFLSIVTSNNAALVAGVSAVALATSGMALVFLIRITYSERSSVYYRNAALLIETLRGAERRAATFEAQSEFIEQWASLERDLYRDADSPDTGPPAEPGSHPSFAEPIGLTIRKFGANHATVDSSEILKWLRLRNDIYHGADPYVRHSPSELRKAAAEISDFRQKVSSEH